MRVLAEFGLIPLGPVARSLGAHFSPGSAHVSGGRMCAYKTEGVFVRLVAWRLSAGALS